MHNRFAGGSFVTLGILLVALIALPAASARAAVGQNPHAQQGTDYPYPAQTFEYPTDPGYAGPTDQSAATITPTSGSALTPTPSAAAGTGTPESTLPFETANPLTPSATAGKDLYGTEDSEIGSARVTPPPSETPIPSPTPTGSPTATPAPAFLQRLEFKRQWFVIGFLIPIGLLALGWLGYRLARTGEFSGKP